MFGANLALILVLGQLRSSPPSTNPAILVAQLGSRRYAEREAAEVALERLGKSALPALRSAKDIPDPEIRTRAAGLIAKIEGGLLTQPTLVTLDFENRPLVDVIKAIGDQSGIKMALFPNPAPEGSDRRITLRARDPLPFWKALDRLCDAAQLQYNFGPVHSMPGSHETVFPLFLGGRRTTAPVFDNGPFRVTIVSFHHQRDLSFVPAPQPIFVNPVAARRRPGAALELQSSDHAITEQFLAQLQVAAEPRLSLSLNGPLKLIEAVDEDGQSLLPPANDPTRQHDSGYFGLTMGSTLPLHAALKHPSEKGGVLKSLKGTLSVLVAAPKPGPLVVPLKGAAGKTFRNANVTLDIHEIRVDANTQQTSIALTVRSIQERGELPVATAGSPVGFVHRPDTFQQQFEVFDAKGRPIRCYHSSDAEGSRMTLMLPSLEQGTPAELRYYSMAKATAEVAFEFHNVPMP